MHEGAPCLDGHSHEHETHKGASASKNEIEDIKQSYMKTKTFAHSKRNDGKRGGRFVKKK